MKYSLKNKVIKPNEVYNSGYKFGELILKLGSI